MTNPTNPPIPTVAVLCEAATQDGGSTEGFRIVARLTALETYEGLVVPEETEGTFDAHGQCVLQLWPNALGVAGSAYRVQAFDTAGRRWMNTTAVVPNSDCRLEQIIVAEPYPAIDAAQQALIAAQGALADVTAQAQAAAAAALVAQDAEDGALAAETAAQASAAAAQANEEAAAASEAGASSSAATATGAATTATTAATAAQDARDAAQVAASTATTQATAASQSAQAADASADAAAASEAAAAASASTAQAQATAAAGSANTAQAQAAAAQQAKTEAQAAAGAAGAAAAQAEDAAETATAQATAATSAATAAAGHATTALGHADTATTKATEAATSATLASTKAGEASTSAAAAAADRVQTGLDVLAAAASEAAAASSAQASADSAADAAQSAYLAGENATAEAAAAAIDAVYSQLTDLKTQTEYARDQALAGLGVADNSQALAALLGAIAYVTDLALKGADGVAENRGTFRETDRAELYALMFGELLGKIGVIGRAVAGGAIALGAGTAGNPSLARLTDENTGLYFPAADVLALVTAGLERLRITADGRLGLGTTTPTGVLDVADNKLRVRSAQTPASATAAGNQGEIAWDANFVYVCTATNTWRRAALSTW